MSLKDKQIYFLKLYILPLGVVIAGLLVYAFVVSVVSDGGSGKMFNAEYFSEKFAKNKERHIPNAPYTKNVIETATVSLKEDDLSQADTKSSISEESIEEENVTDKRAYIDSVSGEVKDTKSNQVILPSADTYVVAVRILNIRSLPNTNGKIISKVPFGLELKVVELVDDTWAKIEGKTIKVGYVVRSMIEKKSEFNAKEPKVITK